MSFGLLVALFSILIPDQLRECVKKTLMDMSTSMTDPLNHKISYFTRSDLLHVCCIRLFWQVNGNLMSIYVAGWEALLQE